MRERCVFLAVALTTLLVAGTGFADTGGGVVSRLEVSGHKDRADVSIAGTFVEPTYSIRAIDEGKTVVIEVPGAKLDGAAPKVRGTAALVVRTAASTSAKGVRLVLGLSRRATYRARSEQGKIRIHLEAENAQPRKTTAGSAHGQPQVQHVTLERRDGRERLVLELNRGADFRVLPGTKGPARLEIKGATLSQDAPHTLSGDEASAVHSVQVRESDGRVLVEVAHSARASGTAIREGNRIVWLFAEEEPERRGVGVQSQTVAREQAIRFDADDAAAFLSDVPMQVRASTGARAYSGRKIDLDFKDADIHNILRLLSEVGNVNVVTADDVTGKVTIKMKAVPWDQALDVILSAKGLGMVRRGNLIRVAPQETLEKERELAIERQKQKIELAPLETRIVPVSYASAGDLAGRAKELLSERGKVSVDDRTNVLLVRDVADTLDDVEELVRSLDTQTPQVLIEARIVEASTSFSSEFGVQWGGSSVFSSATGNPTGLVFPSDVAIAGGASDAITQTAGLSPFSRIVPNPNFVVNLPAPAGTGVGGAIGMSLGSLAGNFNLSLRLSAFESNGQVRIISSPRILTLDNYEATIQQGTSIPYSQISAQGVQTAFQEATLQLKVTPHVTSDGAVSMEVKIQRDEPDFNQTSARGDPTILKRSAQTSLLVQDGHTAVIGGIYTRNTGRGIDQVPFFGDIPIIGVLFQHRTHSDTRNELLIFLTPRVVNRVESTIR